MAGAIANLSVTLGSSMAYSAPHSDPVLGTQNVNSSLGLSQFFGSISGAVFGANQCKFYTGTLAGSGVVTLDLHAASANILGDVTATFARIFGAFIWLPTLAQNVNLGSNATGLIIGNAASTIATLFGLAGTNVFNLGSGEWQSWLSPAGGAAGTSGGCVVSTNKSLLITNSDSVNSAKYVLGLIGNDA